MGMQRSLADTLRNRGWEAYRKQARIYDLFIELAFKKYQLSRHPTDRGTAAKIAHLRQEIARLRDIG